MTNIELQALRKLFLLDVAEAAEEIGHVSPRSWQYWESGRSPVPDDVATKMEALAKTRGEMLSHQRQEMSKAVAPHAIQFYRTRDAYTSSTGDQSAVMWRLNQSVAAALFAEDGAILSDG